MDYNNAFSSCLNSHFDGTHSSEHNIFYLSFFNFVNSSVRSYITHFQCGPHCLFSKSINYACVLGSCVVKVIVGNKVWTGVTDSTGEGTWTWVNSTTVISG